MNEKIKQLTDKIWAEEYWTDPNTDKLLPVQLNRFAELIVKECADWVKSRTMSNELKQELKRHFGVK